jgi:hypothetical protein
MMPKEYYDNEEERFWKLQNSLQITVKNVIAFFLGRIRSGEKKGKIQYVEGDEIHEKISLGEINSEFYYCDKYVRIKGHGQDETEYDNDILESKIPQDRVYIDRNGFVWRNEAEE